MKHRFSAFSFLFFSFLLSIQSAVAQQKSSISGYVRDEKNTPLAGVSVSVKNFPKGTFTDEQGFYSLQIDADTTVVIQFSYIGYETADIAVKLKEGESRKLDKSFSGRIITISEVTIEDEQARREGITKINPKLLANLPNVSGSFESILKTLPGVSSNNELSSQYSVRGGNYDENLVYVNDIEIYRPFLIRSGQQEGLSFINSDMVSQVKFSAGGFDAKYGDKLSSVLDINYKKPKDFGGTASVSLLGGGLSLEGTSPNRRASFLVGVRQKSNQYLLNTLNTRGDYKPSFTDLQSYITYDLSDKFELAFLGNYARNRYLLVPESRETTFGTFGNVLRFSVEFEGQEIDTYESGLGALAASYSPKKNLLLKFISSAYRSVEQENFDIRGEYLFDEVEADFGKETFGEVRANRGIGAFQNHARNYLVATVANAEHKGILSYNKSFLQWGIKYQHEEIEDKLSEWALIDSAGYATPDVPEEIILQDVVKARIGLQSTRYSTYLQNTLTLSDTNNIIFTIGIRANYWDYNKETNISPRAGISIRPNWQRDWVFRLSTGFYYQPPFYRELRTLNGTLNPNIRAQQSTHYVLGGDYNFKAFGGRLFKFTSELYYKQFHNLIPYEVDNVRIRYYATNNAKGYAAGTDFKINGEFVEGLESWFTLSLLQTEEDIAGDFYYLKNSEGQDSTKIYPGYIPRPTDQRVNFSIFFQDKLLKDPSYKVHLNLLYGSRLPIGPPDFNRYRDTLRMPPYRRVDIGFSKELFGKRSGNPNSRLKYFKSVTIYAEVFNLLKISNTVSYYWVRDVLDDLYAIPNYLTSRQLNLKVVAKF